MNNFNERWINLLTGNDVNKKREFEEVFANSKCKSLAIMSLRRELMTAGRGQKITREDLKVANTREESYLILLLQEMFLEPISIELVEYLYQKIVEKGYSIEQGLDKLFDRHIEDRGTRLLSVVLTL